MKTALLLFLILGNSLTWAEEPPRALHPKKLNQNNSNVKRNPDSRRIVRKPASESRENPIRLDISVSTPLGVENLYDRRFLTYGPIFLFNIPFYSIDKDQLFGVQVGLQATVSSLLITQPYTTFMHSYIYFPLYVYYQHPLSDSLSVEGFLGTAICPFAFSTQATSDGGFHVQSDISTFQINAGATLNYLFTSSWYFKLTASYQYLGLGIGVAL